MTPDDLVDAVAAWAVAQPDVAGAALVGSHARGEARPDSDVDFVILTDDSARYTAVHDWAAAFGRVTSTSVEDWGRVRSVRVHYVDGLEAEFGFAAPDWASTPCDAGTRDVVDGGFRILADPAGLLAAL